MKKGFTPLICVAFWLLMCAHPASCHSDQPAAPVHSGDWQLLHNEDGSSEFSIQHDSVRHHYRLKLTALKLGEHNELLANPQVTRQRHYLTKQWLPHLTETWFRTADGWQWVVAVDQLQDFDSSDQPIELSYQVSGDAHGGIVVGESTSLRFDTNGIGEPILPKATHDFSQLGQVFIGTSLSSRCYQASAIKIVPGAEVTKRWEPGIDSMPHILQHGFAPQSINSQSPLRYGYYWYEASMQATEQGLDVLVPTSLSINGKDVDAIEQMHFSGLDSPGRVVLKSDTVNQPDDRPDLIHHANNWHPITTHDLHQSVETFRDAQPKQFIAAIKAALSDIDGLSERIHMGLAITLAADQMMVVAKQSENQEILVFSFENQQWQPKQILKVPHSLHFEDGSKAHIAALSPVVNGDVMVVPVEHIGGSYMPSGSHSMGAIWVYRKVRNRWQHEDTLTPDLGDREDMFGLNLVVGHKQIIVAANQYGAGYHDSLPGLVHVFKHRQGKWSLAQTLRPTAGSQKLHVYGNDGFGSQMALAVRWHWWVMTCIFWPKTKVSAASLACPNCALILIQLVWFIIINTAEDNGASIKSSKPQTIRPM